MKSLLFLKKILPYIVLALLTILTFFFIYRNWGLKLNIPFFYRGDDLWNFSGIKGFIEQGSFFVNKNLGAPFGNNYYDYPSSEIIFKIPIILLTQFIKDPVAVINTYYLLTFILTSLISYFVLSYFKIINKLAILASLLISFLPYHLLKGTSHINLSTYYLIPLVFLVLFWLFDDQITINFKFSKNNKFLWSVVLMILIANSGIYYAFFTIFFLIVTGILSCFRKKKISNFFISSFLSFIIFLTVFINILPNINHQIKFGRNQLVAARSYNEAEYYGLKIIELFLPTSNFKNDIIRKYKERYYNFTITKSEGSSYLGIIGSIGFIILILNLFTKKSYDKKIDFLSYLNFSALLLAVPTGIGTMIGYLSAQIRVYSRISVFINIFAIFALVFIADRLIKKYNVNKLIINSLLIFLFAVAIIDQGIPKDINAKGMAGLYYSDKRFIERVEKKLNYSGMIFQLPYKAFPETGPINQLTDYDLFRGYVHSKNLKWSYGIIKGTSQDQWIKTISSLPTQEMIEKITLAGYGGIYIDTVGYLDRGKELENQISMILEEKPIRSDQNDLIFFSLKNYQKKLINQYGENKLENMRKQILTLPIIIGWGKGFYQEETDNINNWHWSKKQSVLTIINDNPGSKDVFLKFSLMSNYPEYSNLKISSKLFSRDLKINGTKINFEKKVKLIQDQYQIKFDTDSKKAVSPTDSRELYFRIFNFEIKQQ